MSDNTKQPDNAVPDTESNDPVVTDTAALSAIGQPTESADNQEGSEQTGQVEVGTVPAQLGSGRFVHAAFFAAAALSGYLSARLFTSLWNWLAEWPFAVQHLPQLLRLSEDERASVGSIVGVAVGLSTLIYLYRRPSIRAWAEEVAGELSKVTWPDRETVTNGTVIVIVASLVATVYVTLLDRLWGFATRLIYGS